MIQLSGIHRCLYTQQFERKQGDKVKLPSTSVLLSPVSPEALLLCFMSACFKHLLELDSIPEDNITIGQDLG